MGNCFIDVVVDQNRYDTKLYLTKKKTILYEGRTLLQSALKIIAIPNIVIKKYKNLIRTCLIKKNWFIRNNIKNVILKHQKIVTTEIKKMC
jgi:hypothetical protein